MVSYSGNQEEVYIEVVQGFGETLVGNCPGQAMQAAVNKQALPASLKDCSSTEKMDADVLATLQQAVTVSAYPSKSVALMSSCSSSRSSPAYILRSDSNGEDLEG